MALGVVAALSPLWAETSTAELLALAVGYRHSTARHAGEGPECESPVGLPRELDFLADALLHGAGHSSP